jgi:hypothetical protein
MHEPIALATSFPAGSRIRLFATAMTAYASPTPWWGERQPAAPSTTP